MTEPDEFDYEAGPAELGLEAPEADAAEQGVPADPALRPVEFHRGPEVDEGDALEQSWVVRMDEDENRP